MDHGLRAQALRDIVIGIGGKMDGFMMKSGFAIAVSSEIMAILSVATDLKDMRERMGKIVVAYDKKGNPVTTADLEVDGDDCLDGRSPKSQRCRPWKDSPCSSTPGRLPISLWASLRLLRIALLLRYDYTITNRFCR